MSVFLSVIYTVTIAFLANSYALSSFVPIPAVLFAIIIPVFLWIQFVPAYGLRKIHTMRLRVCQSGCQLLLLFIFSTVITVVFSVVGFVGRLPVGGIWEQPFFWIAHSLIAFLVEAIVFWNGMIRVYATSVQLGIKIRVLGALLGLIPIAHLIMLGIIIHKARKEVKVEEAKIRLDEERRQEQICHTKYPILLVHGVFFRDTRYMNYWGRIPKELETNGAKVYYGNQPSALSVADSARYLAGRIEEILGETGADIWGERYENLTVKGTRGISHGDMIDLNRENYDAFDVREYYVTLVSQLREHGF